ncbi:hypothetical protein J7T55_003107 [Diaporthe amygdali]|uniref:uncharacterized protein n=1 Tax=Phomopsis amygdali TaxID=1214568 RepID=UPI0022FE2CCA|nr:uncharacterized protein J7T55_003107 [Diaporthe amygdali]KAJ0122593.1 hypothetical protein J7T55_003107 [Diaporthe amygdali]
MTTTTSTYSSPIQSSFPLDALTTTFTAPASCSGVYSSAGIAIIDDDLACLPQGFTSLSTNYFSPGIACPAGYVTACSDNAGVSSITTVTCCPYRGDITLGCVTPSTLEDVWKTLFCTWIAPEAGTTVKVTQSADGTTSTAAVSMESPGGINALGVRMVYQSSDMTTAADKTNGGSGTSTATSSGATSTTDSGSGSSAGLSTGVTIAIAVIIPVVAIAVAAALFFWIRKRKQAQRAQPSEGAGTSYDYSKNGYSAVAAGGGFHDPKSSPAPPSEVSGVGAYGVRNQQQELVELGHQQPPVELPAEHQYR